MAPESGEENRLDLTELLRIQGKLPGKKTEAEGTQMLKKVGLDEKIADRYPNQLSGGGNRLIGKR